MEAKSLHIAFRKAINQFGIGILTESRLTNILLDYRAYADVPAAKTIIQAMVAGGYGQKIIDLGKQKRYWVEHRSFSTAEVKLLIDMVYSSKFITKKKSINSKSF